MAEGVIRAEIGRPAVFTQAPIPLVQNGNGWVQWIEVDTQDRPFGGKTRWFEIEGAETAGEEIEKINLSTRVVRADEIETSSDFLRRIFMELGEIVKDRWQTSARRAETLPVRKPSEEYSLLSFISTRTAVEITGMAGLDVIHATFNFPRQTQQFSFLPQNKKRRRGLVIFGAKKTRSNAANFANFRVPHK